MHYNNVTNIFINPIKRCYEIPNNAYKLILVSITFIDNYVQSSMFRWH